MAEIKNNHGTTHVNMFSTATCVSRERARFPATEDRGHQRPHQKNFEWKEPLRKHGGRLQREWNVIRSTEIVVDPKWQKETPRMAILISNRDATTFSSQIGIYPLPRIAGDSIAGQKPPHHIGNGDES
jgi:hypothetical protein